LLVILAYFPRRSLLFCLVTRDEEWKGKKGRGGDEEEGGDGKGQGKKEEKRRKCEAIMNEKAVEASFAKGEWGIRWRE